MLCSKIFPMSFWFLEFKLQDMADPLGLVYLQLAELIIWTGQPSATQSLLNVNTLWEGPTAEVNGLSPAAWDRKNTQENSCFQNLTLCCYRWVVFISSSWPTLTVDCFGQSDICRAKITWNWVPRVLIPELLEIRVRHCYFLTSALSPDSWGAWTRLVILGIWSLEDLMYQNNWTAC